VREGQQETLTLKDGSYKVGLLLASQNPNLGAKIDHDIRSTIMRRLEKVEVAFSKTSKFSIY